MRQSNEHIKESRYEDMTSKEGNASTYQDMKICHVPSIYRYTAMFAKQATSGAKIDRHFLQRLFSSDTKSIFDTINRDAIPLFRLISENAIAPKNQPMPIHRPIETNATRPNLAQRLLQLACIYSSSYCE